jgi:hypothetical protein
MTSKQPADLQEQLRRNAVTIRQTVEAIAAADAQRVEAVRSGELEIVRRIDKRIADLNTDYAALEEQHDWLASEAAGADRARREERRLAAVADRKARLGAREVSAQKLDEGLAQLSAAFANLERADTALFEDWPTELPPAETLRYLRLMNAETLTNHRRPRVVAGVVRDAVGRGPYGFGEEAARRNAELIAALEAAPSEVTDKAVAS